MGRERTEVAIEIPDDWTMPSFNNQGWAPEPNVLVVGEAVYAALEVHAAKHDCTVDELGGIRVVKVTRQ